MFLSLLIAAVLSWGAQGNGTYINPVLNADYSDPDVIRVGDRYYMVASDFHFMGMPVLESSDLVNWKIIAQAFDGLGFPEYERMERYAGGSWAPALRYHDGRYYIYFCTPHEGLFMTSATDPAGPWEPLHCVKAVEKWEDPCPFWDDDGQAYLVRSRHRAGPIIIHRMSPDGRELLDDGFTVYTGPVAEGPKMMKRDGYYYILIPEGGVGEGWQTALRSRNIYGPYEKHVVLEQGSTAVNGPHQGALVDTPAGADDDWWFLHFQHVHERGRVVHLQPARWVDGWPEIGVDIDRNGIGEPVTVWTLPIAGKGDAPSFPAASDSFDSPVPGLQWQANHKYRPDLTSLTERPGSLTMTAACADSLRNAPGTIVQKLMGYTGTITTLLDPSDMTPGQRAGLTIAGKRWRGIGAERTPGGSLRIYTETGGKADPGPALGGKKRVWLRAEIDTRTNRNRFLYSTDGKHFTPAGEEFPLRDGDWKGPRPGLYSYSTATPGGKARFEFFNYTFD